MKGYIKLPPIKVMSDSRTELRKLDDKEWKNYIFFHLLQFYKNVDNKHIVALIENETKKSRANIEREIKKHIRNWLKWESQTFNEQGFKINLEPSAECNNEGYIDLQFEHSDWQNKYFSFEAKNLGKIKKTKLSKSISEYVYVKTKDRENGGMYRFMTSKYACDINFGGMLGFVVGKTKENIIKSLTEEIKFIYNNKKIGNLTGKKIIYNSIENNKNTFNTIHIRKNYLTQKEEEFYLYHIIMDFSIS